MKPFGSQLQSSLKATEDKANALEEENQDLRQDVNSLKQNVNSLKSGRTTAFVLVGLLVVTVIILFAGSVTLYKKIKSFQS